MSAGDLENCIFLFQSLNLLILMLKQVKVIGRRVSPTAYQRVKVDLLAFSINQLSSFAVCIQLDQSLFDRSFSSRHVCRWFESFSNYYTLQIDSTRYTPSKTPTLTRRY